jgi:catechol 2,3-dioxygenase
MAIPNLSFSHIGLFVRDLAAMEDFYTRALGFTVTDRGPLPGVELVFLSRDPSEHHQIVLASGRPADTHFNVVNQVSFRVPALADLRILHAALAAEPRVSEIRPVTHGNAWSVYCRDPEGNRLEFFVDAPWYTPQPFREPLDLGLSDREIEVRTEAQCRARPGFVPREEWRARLARRMKEIPLSPQKN